MATSETTNLQLVKYGAGTDNFIRTDYNGNLDKIDTFAGNTNEAIASLFEYKNIGQNSSETFSNCKNGTVFILRNTNNNEGYAFMVVDNTSRVKLFGTDTGLTITQSGTSVTIATASGNNAYITRIN